MSMLISQQHLFQALSDRADRLKKSCCICEDEGWLLHEKEVPEIKKIMVSSCDDHFLCRCCLGKLANNYFRNLVQRKRGKCTIGKLMCPFTYSSPCKFEINLSLWKSFLNENNKTLFRNLKLVKNKHKHKTTGFRVSCTKCGCVSFLKNPFLQWKCKNCFRISCGKCDLEECSTDDIICAKGHGNQYSRYFFTTRKDEKPMFLRCSDVDENMVKEFLAQVFEHSEFTFSKCPTCKVALEKSSACNDMVHCGNMHVCNFCQQVSFPWENGIDTDHWNDCNRWDDMTWLKCKEGACFTDFKDCQDPDHVESILKLHAIRKRAVLVGVQKEVGKKFPHLFSKMSV